MWVTGASSGIGAALASALVREGACVIASARRVEQLEAVRSACAVPERMRILSVDLADVSALERAAAEASAMWGRIDVLICNAGISQRSTAEETPMSAVRAIMEINVTILCPGYVNTEISLHALAGDHTHGKRNADVSAGMPPEHFAERALVAIAKRKREVLIGGPETWVVLAMRLFPGLVARQLHRFAPK